MSTGSAMAWCTSATAPRHEQTVSQLASDGGLPPIDVGPLSRAQQLEQLGFLHISLQQPLGLGFDSAIRLHP
jgi:predicted dinucleotide-binding enzyme